MGTFSCPVAVRSADGSHSATVEALVDTGSTYTCLPDALLRDLGITPRRLIRTELADGRVVTEGIGEASVRVEGVEVTTIVIFAGEGAPALLGAYTLEGALLAVAGVLSGGSASSPSCGLPVPPRRRTATCH